MKTTRPVGSLPIPPTTSAERALAPDLARGAMLLLIALANASWYLWAGEQRLLSPHPTTESPVDLVVQTFSLIAIDGRTYPMFAALFGYGVWQLYARQRAAGVAHAHARKLLLRRHVWMLVFGAVHAALLWAGDVVGAYGLAGIVVVWFFLRRRDATLAVWAGVLSSLFVAAMVAVGVFTVIESLRGGAGSLTLEDTLPTGIATVDYLTSVRERLLGWPLVVLTQGLLALVTPIAVLAAMFAARRRVLENPAEHMMFLRRVAIGGVSVGWITGAIVAGQNLDAWGLGRAYDGAFSGLQAIGGLACGLGYVALFGLIAERISRGSPGRLVRAARSLGRRSLSGYLAQSVLMAPLLAAWGLGLGAHLSSWSMALVAIAVWALTLVGADALERAGRAGPAEWALRRLAYPRR